MNSTKKILFGISIIFIISLSLFFLYSILLVTFTGAFPPGMQLDFSCREYIPYGQIHDKHLLGAVLIGSSTYLLCLFWLIWVSIKKVRHSQNLLKGIKIYSYCFILLILSFVLMLTMETIIIVKNPQWPCPPLYIPWR